jgi:hypothetical protein
LYGSAFLDISKAIDKLWHEGLLHKIKTVFPDSIHKILKSYLENRYFLLKYREELISLQPVLSGVPQGSVLGTFVYLFYTADLPTTADSTTATFADDTAVLTTHEYPAIATQTTNTFKQNPIMVEKWRTKANETKSVQVTFTLKNNTCPPVQLNNEQLTQAEELKYLCIHLDRKLTGVNISTERKQLDLKLRKLYWIIDRKSQR